MNMHFPETPSNRNAPWSQFRDERPGDEREPTPAENARECVVDEVRLLLLEARHAYRDRGLDAGEMVAIEELAVMMGVKL